MLGTFRVIMSTVENNHVSRKLCLQFETHKLNEYLNFLSSQRINVA